MNYITAYTVGFWVTNKYRNMAKTHGTDVAARNLRKQGYPLDIALDILLGAKHRCYRQ